MKPEHTHNTILLFPPPPTTETPPARGKKAVGRWRNVTGVIIIRHKRLAQSRAGGESSCVLCVHVNAESIMQGWEFVTGDLRRANNEEEEEDIALGLFCMRRSSGNPLWAYY